MDKITNGSICKQVLKRIPVMPNRGINMYAHLFVYIDNKMAVVVDLTKQNATSFEGSSEEDINYATNFWQSIQLHPPMESRLVSSDIKQRLKVAPPSSQGKQLELINERQNLQK